MKIREIVLNNFRQFYGSQSIKVSTDPKKNVTLIHAENGFGKTTLLNALLWCFYDKTTPKFENKKDIVNHQAHQEGKTNAYVEVVFEQNDEVFLARRDVTKGRESKSVLTVFQATKGNNKVIDANSESFINSVVPSEMAQYFFLDGEQAESFSSENNSKEVGGAIRNILGCNSAVTALEDLRYFSKEYDKQIAELPGQGDLKDREIEKRALVEELESLEQILDRIDEKKTLINENLERIDDELENVKNVEGIAQRRRDLEIHKDDALKRQDLLVKRREEWFSDYAHIIVSSKLSAAVSSALSDKNHAPRIPSPYNKDFIDAILRNGICICGRKIVEGSSEFGCVTQLLSNAPTNEVQNRAFQSKAHVNEVTTRRTECFRTFRSIEAERASNEEAIRDIEIEIDGIEERLAGFDVEEVRKKEALRQKLKAELEENQKSHNENLIRQGVLKNEIVRKSDDIDKLAESVKRAQPLIIRRKICDSSRELLANVLSSYEREAKQEIQNKINKILERTAHKDYQMTIEDKFALKMRYRGGQESPKSGGENQLLSLAFIAALVEFAEDRIHDQSEILIPGTVAPLVLDSPFGQLDREYKSATAAFLPEMASQVVLLVSSSQGSKDVMDVVRNYTGKEYVLISENKGPRGRRKKHSIRIDGTPIQVSNFNSPKTFTRIEEIDV